MKTYLRILCSAGILLLTSTLHSRVNAQTNAAPAASGPSLETTLQFIVDKVNAEGKISYHQEIRHPEGGHYDRGQLDNWFSPIKANPAACTIGFVNLAKFKNATIKSKLQVEQEGDEGKDGWIVTVSPNYYELLIRTDGLRDPINWDFREQDTANRVLKALLHAVDLCGGASKEPF